MRLPSSSRSARYTVAWADHLRKASRLPSAVFVASTKQNPAQSVTRLGSSSRAPLRGSTAICQNLQLSRLGSGSDSEYIIRLSGSQRKSINRGSETIGLMLPPWRSPLSTVDTYPFESGDLQGGSIKPIV